MGHEGPIPEGTEQKQNLEKWCWVKSQWSLSAVLNCLNFMGKIKEATVGLNQKKYSQENKAKMYIEFYS